VTVATTKRQLWESVYYAITNSRTLTVKTVTYLPHERAHIDTILGAFLDAAGMRPLKNKLSYCIHELAGNAKKANTKRLFFREKNLEISSEKDYVAGMGDFKREMVERVDYYLEKLRAENLYVKFQFRKIKNGVRISVRNNTELTPVEESRIKDKLAIAERYNCLADAYSTTEDGAEGAGLGIVMMLFMLKNLGFGSNAFNVRTAQGETIATLTLIAPPEMQGATSSGSATA
jgi:hypothetical protein